MRRFSFGSSLCHSLEFLSAPFLPVYERGEWLTRKAGKKDDLL